jgi:hypothetical protein
VDTVTLFVYAFISFMHDFLFRMNIRNGGERPRSVREGIRGLSLETDGTSGGTGVPSLKIFDTPVEWERGEAFLSVKKEERADGDVSAFPVSGCTVSSSSRTERTYGCSKWAKLCAANVLSLCALTLNGEIDRLSARRGTGGLQ